MDTKELKFRFGQKYNLPESSIDDSLLPLFVSNELLEETIKERLSENTKISQALTEKVKGSIKTIHYDNAKVAFIGNLGVYAVPSLIFCVTILIIWWGLVYKQTQIAKYENFERLSKIITIQDSVYFIPREKYKISKKGIILVEK
jgi:hypothetical protein